MEPVRKGTTGVAVEDIQDRRTARGYRGSEVERQAQESGPSTAAAVERFREDTGMLADGMAFQDPVQALGRLSPGWGDTEATGVPDSLGAVGFARAGSVL